MKNIIIIIVLAALGNSVKVVIPALLQVNCTNTITVLVVANFVTVWLLSVEVGGSLRRVRSLGVNWPGINRRLMKGALLRFRPPQQNVVVALIEDVGETDALAVVEGFLGREGGRLTELSFQGAHFTERGPADIC